MPQSSFDFAYPWWLSYGHLILAAVLAGTLVAGRVLSWARWLMIVLGLAFIWAATAATAMHWIGINVVPALPTQTFLQSGEGRVLDLGAGTGRSAIMVLTERPRTSLVALDLFGDSFEHHFGQEGSPEERLLRNLCVAGVEGRVTIQRGDMLGLPFDAAAFDAIVSAYAIDHLGRTGATTALAEAHRVLKPGGDFLMMVVANDRWTKLAFGPLLSHGGTSGAAWWRERASAAGFEVIEEGTRPATLFILLRKPAPQS
jgi:SAM-dependent methyltransferase